MQPRASVRFRRGDERSVFICDAGREQGFMALCRTLKFARELPFIGGALKDSPTLSLQLQVRLQ